MSSRHLGLPSDGHLFSLYTGTTLEYGMPDTFHSLQLFTLAPLARHWGDRGHTLPPPFKIEQDLPFFLFFHCEDGGLLLLRELSVSLWLGLPLYNGIKFKFKCGRDVKSTVRKKIGDCERLQEHWGRLVVAFYNYRIIRKQCGVRVYTWTSRLWLAQGTVYHTATHRLAYSTVFTNGIIFVHHNLR